MTKGQSNPRAARHEPLGDAAVAVRLEREIAPQIDPAALPRGVADVVTAFGRAVAYFDPSSVGGESPSQRVGAWLVEHLASTAEQAPNRRAIELPVLYGGAAGPDLAELAEHVGLSAAEVVALHAREYRVAAVGFQPGFPYLDGLAPELQAPRLDTPRVRVPAGSVAIGGPYTGVYPSESPGGWRLIGRTPMRLFDPHREPPALARAGDLVRFRAIDEGEFDRIATQQPLCPPGSPPRGEPLLRLPSAGAWTALCGAEHAGRRHTGQPAGGPMDHDAYRLAVALAGADPGSLALEATLVGPVVECLRYATLGVAGAAPSPLRGARKLCLSAGERVDLRHLNGGVRVYIAAAGGLAGVEGERLADGSMVLSAAGAPDEALGGSPAWWGPTASRRGVLRILPGPQTAWLSDEGWRQLCRGPWRVASQSNRMGVRLEGEPVPTVGAPPNESQPTCHGAIQLPGDGQPILLGADAQTLGGYPIVGVVASVDWPLLGQLRPGDPVRFEPITLAQAERVRRQADRDLAIAIEGFRLRS